MPGKKRAFLVFALAAAGCGTSGGGVKPDDMMAVRPSPRSAGGLLRSPVAVAPSWPEMFAPTPQAAEPATARAMTGRRTRGRGVLCMNA